ncbi:MAG: hypothetical protein HZB40_03050 [Rhodocyclales bacterium]|nr:hypothetical protein [Rhodocyclales bacterium]
MTSGMPVPSRPLKRIVDHLPEAANDSVSHFAANSLGADALPASSGFSLPAAFLASAMIHFGLALILSSPLGYEAVSDTSPPPLTVKLAQADPPSRARPMKASEPRVIQAPDVAPGSRESADEPKRSARFLADPDLSILETIPATMPGAVSLRLHVTSLGHVERVTVVRSDPVPKELLDGLIERFREARLSPASIGNTPVASTLEITVRVDPGAQLLDLR